ncbi:potassium-transporting ATPase subunit KdpC [Paenibacillus glufosinatiresistens]|uniref:potassium-transporting ATPase subunit KdpC n=1 Tax=Paenibacillus glufosinatiresistens TaxID=3070657 RepID=UPI00286DDEC8|nr:potassium-transporting ATPase subunit KdpC [Paenibacillus sp. YX.27]
MKTLMITIRTSLALMALFIIYQLAVTGIAQIAFKDRASGSIVYGDNGQPVGSALIGQGFASPGYFHGRVSSIEYNAASSGTPNYAPSNPDYLARVSESVKQWKKENPEVPVDRLPVDLITNSGSGLDPDISPEAAEAQIPRVSQASGVAEDALRTLVKEHTAGRQLGLFGEKHVNVLELNLALSKLVKR